MNNHIETNDTFGIKVTCSETQWNNHIILHKVMENNENAVIDTITTPDIVYQSSKYNDRKVFFKKSSFATYSDNLYTKVIVGYTLPNEGEIVTAFPVDDIRGGISNVIYTK